MSDQPSDSGVEPRMRRFRIAGMDCADEVATLRRVLSRLPGVESIEADLVDRLLYVAIADGGTTDAKIVSEIATTGMTAELARTEEAGGTTEHRRLSTILAGVSGLALFAGIAVRFATDPQYAPWSSEQAEGGREVVPWPSRILYGVAIAAAAWTIAPRAVASARRFRPDMNLLMSIAVTGAIAIGEWLEAASVSFLFSLSLALEVWSVDRARRAVGALLAVAPPEARVIDEAQPSGYRIVAARDVQVGSKLTVLPGDRVPLDGKIILGNGALDESALSGESRPVEKGPGQEVLAGSINGDSTLSIETTRPHDDTLIARIVRLVGEARAQRGPAQRFVDRFAAVYTPIVLVVAVGVATIAPLVIGGPWRDWLYRSLVFLVISCPCALVISTPVGIVCALARAAREGVLIKGAEFVEGLASIEAVAFDKTGTLTVGRPHVVAVTVAEGVTENRLIEIAAGVESASTHPLGRAVTEYALEHGVRTPTVSSSSSLQGRGATAVIDGKEAWVGSHRYLDERGGEGAILHDAILKLEAGGATIAAVGFDGAILGAIALEDRVRPEARAAVDSLRDGGIRHLAMLSGDHSTSARAIGALVGIDDVRAQLSPDQKVREIAEMIASWEGVAMVGDGVNDAPSLARATVGIAMGGSGSDAAIETSDVTLMRDDLMCLPWMLRFARSARSTIRFNVAASLLVKAVFVVLAFFGIASLWSAIAADMGVSFGVVANALRLLKYRGLKS